MPVLFGVTSGGVLIPLQVDANGVVSVSAVITTLPTLPAGDNNIGNVDVVTLPALPAGSNLIGKIQANNYGLIGGSFHKDPIRFGYSGPVFEAVDEFNLAAGTNTLDSNTVPSGEIWVITNIACAYTGTVATVELQMQIDHNGTRYTLWEVGSLTSALYCDRQGFWVLDAGDYVRMVVANATLNDNGHFRITGYRVDVDQ